MSALPKILLILALWLLYTFLLYRGCAFELCEGCSTEEAALTVIDSAAADTINRFALGAKWSDVKVYQSEKFTSFNRDLLAKMTDKNILEITGYYFEGEDQPEGAPNAGLARAGAIRNLFPQIPDDRIRLRARLIDEKEGVRTGFFEAADFEWDEPEEQVAETVEELDDRIIIRFLYNSTEKETNPEVDDYLRKLAERIRSSGETVQLTGHADNTGTPEYNLRLGQSRAEQIRQILTGYGVPGDQISVASKGESQPVASNDTEEGRQENRRVELRLIKK